MPKDSIMIKHFRDIIKIFGVALAVYLALTVKTWLTGEPDQVSQYDYLGVEEQIISELDINEETNSNDWEHESSSMFSKLCSKYNTVCKKITRSWVFNDQDKATKFAYVTYLLKYMDWSIKRGETPSKALAQMLINEAKWNRRWSANHSTVTVNLWWMNYSNEFFQVISHEMWHIVDLWWLQWVSKKKSANFTEFNKEVFAIDDPSLEYYKYSWSSEKVRKADMTREDFCSWYGMSDPFEDFAECHNLYLNHHDYFHKIALANNTVKNKYNYFANLYGWKYINDSEAHYEDRDNSYRARDTTKLIEW